ncbi:MAG TPA: response regulator [bacterium]
MLSMIMIIEDDETLLRLYRQELESEGYTIIPVEYEWPALEILKKEPVALIILEAHLMNDFDFRHLQRFLDINPHVRIIVNSYATDCEMDFRSWAADAFLSESHAVAELKD